MEQFIDKLAKELARLNYSLFIEIPQATTSEDCLKRILYEARYKQALAIANELPVEYRNLLKQKFSHYKNPVTV